MIRSKELRLYYLYHLYYIQSVFTGNSFQKSNKLYEIDS